MVNSHETIIHKSVHKKWLIHNYAVYKKNHPVAPKGAANVFGPEYTRLGKTFQSKALSQLTKRIKIKNYLEKKGTTKAILKREW